DSPVSVFVRIPPEILPEGGRLSLQFVCKNGTIRFESVALHDIEVLSLPSEEKMSIGFFSPRICGNDMEKDVALIEQMKSEFGTSTMYSFMMGFDIHYMLRTDRQLEKTLSYLLELARRTETELFLDYNTWWGGTPSGPDGRGGYFYDMEYNQVNYDPLTGKYNLSVPNMWSNTPWYTMNHENLNEVRKQRALIAVDILQRLLAKQYHHAADMPKVSMFIDNEPTYWANCAYSNSPDSGGGFCLAAHQAALKDGVSMRPEGGPITKEQRLWMLKNLNDYISEISTTLRRGADQEYGFVSDGVVTYENKTLAEQIYTHVFPTPGYPYFNFKYPQWETHVTADAKLGLENCLWGDLRIMDYAVQFGKVAEINAERCCYKTDHTFLHMYYIYGAEAGIIFNYFPADPYEIGNTGEAGETLFKEPDYGYPIYTYDVFFDEENAPGLVANDRMAIHPYRQRKVLQPEEPGTASITLQVGKVSDYPYGARLELQGFAKPKNGGVHIFVGKEADNFTWDYELPQHDNTDTVMLFDLPIEGYAPEDTIYLKIEITSTTFDEDWAQLNYIWSIRVLARHEQLAGHLDGFCFTYDQKRALSKMVIYRKECEKLITRYPWLEQTVASLLEAKQYIAAYQTMNRLLSQEKTDRFYLQNSGPLGRYPFTATVSAPVYISLSEEEGRLVLTAEGEPGTEITLTGTAGFSTIEVGENCWQIRQGEENTALLTVQKKTFPLQGFVGRFCHWDSGDAVVETQDLANYHYQNRFALKVREDAKILLRQDGEAEYMAVEFEKISGGDMLEAKLVDGVATELRFTHGECRGKIQSITQIEFVTAAHNAFITVLNEKGKLQTFEVGRTTALNYPDAPAGDVLCCGEAGLGLKEGTEIKIHYCPYCTNGRVARALSISYE
ncbi:MAG: hypothetical protein IJD11_03785, partial [Oscillospiraceae bacterium]|nr:hypothetical protein [Oscillospiraceae bacterium]